MVAAVQDTKLAALGQYLGQADLALSIVVLIVVVAGGPCILAVLVSEGAALPVTAGTALEVDTNSLCRARFLTFEELSDPHIVFIIFIAVPVVVIAFIEVH